MFQNGTLPEPSINVVMPQSQPLGESTEITFTATNHGATASTQTIEVSIPGVTSSEVSVIPSLTDLSYVVYPINSPVQGCYGLCTATLNNILIVASGTNWPTMKIMF